MRRSIQIYTRIVLLLIGLCGLSVVATARPGSVAVPISPTALTSQTATVGQPFSYTVPAFTETTSQTLSYAIAGVPASLTANNTTRVISGTPTAAGAFTVTVVATGPQNSTASASFLLTIAAAVVPNQPPIGQAINSQTALVGNPFAFTLPAFTDPENQSLAYAVSGLPASLSFNALTRVISGTPTTAGISPVTVLVTDPGGLTASATFTITITRPPVSVSIVSSATVICGNAGTSVTLTASGGTAYVWSNGSTSASIVVLPVSSTVLSVTGTDGSSTATASATITVITSPTITITGSVSLCPGASTVLTATPGASLSYVWSANVVSSTANVATVNAPGTYSVAASASGCPSVSAATTVVSATALAVSLATNSLLTCAQTSVTLTATGGGTPSAFTNYSFSNGQTGPGNTIVVSTTGVYSVLATGPGTCPASATVAVAQNPTLSAPTVFNLTGGGAFCGNGATIGLSGSQATVTYVVLLNGTPITTQVGTGTALVLGQFRTGTYTVRAVDNISSCSALINGSITAIPNTQVLAVSISGSNNFSITARQTVSLLATVTGFVGMPAIVWTPTPQLVSGNIAIVSQPGVYRVSVTDTGAPDCPPATASVTVVRASSAPVVVGQIPSLTAAVGQVFSYNVAGVFSDPEGFSLAYGVFGFGTLPIGITRDGTITGIFPSSAINTPFSVTVVAINANGLSAQTVFSLIVSPSVATNVPPTAPAVPQVPAAPAGQPFTFLVPAFTDANGDLLTYAAIGLPAGLTFSTSTRVISGTPTSVGVANVVITATDPGGLVASVQFPITISLPILAPLAPTVGLLSATVGQPFSYTLPAFIDPNGNGGLFRLSTAIVPQGSLSFNVNTRILSGTPSMTGVILVTITQTNEYLLSGSVSFSVTVSPAPVITVPPPVTVTTPTQLVLLPPTYNCQTGAIQFNTSGGNGSVVSFTVPGVSRTSLTSVTGTVEPGLRADPKTLTISASQSGSIATPITFNLRTACGSRLAATAQPDALLQVLVMGNPTQNDYATVEVRGAEGQRLQLTMRDMQGRLLTEQHVDTADAIERQTVRLGSEAGLYLLTISTNTQRQTVKIVRQ